VEENTMLERPSRVTFALGMLYLSLGISVTRLLVTRLGFGDFGPPEYSLAPFLIAVVTSFLFQGSMWMIHGGILIVPIAAWLYYMVAKGKNWARMTVPIIVLLETLASILSVIIAARAPVFDETPPTLSDFLICYFPVILQLVLRIVAVTLLFGRVSSNWFKAMKNLHGTTKLA
jgi:hypothetical protein